MHNRGENPVKYLWRLENEILNLLSAAANDDKERMSMASAAIFADVKRSRPTDYELAASGKFVRLP